MNIYLLQYLVRNDELKILNQLSYETIYRNT